MGFHKGRFVSIALAALLGGGLIACDSDKNSQKSEATEEAAEAAAEEKVEINVEDLPFYASETVARVNGQDIDAYAFNKVVKERTERLPGPLPPHMIEMFKTQTLDYVIDKHLVDGVLKSEQIEVTDADVDKAVEEFRSNFPDEAIFETYLEQLGMTLDEIRDSMREDVELEKYLVKRYDLKVTDEQMQEYFEEHKEQFAQPEQAHARHILIEVPRDADEAAVKDAEKRAQEIYKEASAEGADFEALARAKSEGPTAPRGGDLGFFVREQMVPEFSEVAFNLEPGGVSEPVRSPFGFHIIQLVELREAKDADFDEAKDRINLQLRHDQRGEAFMKFLDELKEGATIERFPDSIESNAAEEQPPAMPDMPQFQLQQGGQDGQGSSQGGNTPQLKIDPSLQ